MYRMTTRPTETDVLTLSPGQVTPSLALRNNSALIGCTTIDSDSSGRVILVRNWPQLSSGEERLWSVMAWLNGQGSYPDMGDLQAHLDVQNYAAAVTAVNS